jgi:outer membrane protein assembly factor BamB
MALGIDLLYSSDPEMREVLRQMVSRLDQAAILPTLLASLREADAAVRDTALSLLGDADQQLVQVLAAGDPAEQQQAAYALGQLGVRHAVEPLVTSAHSSKVDEVREQAIEALAEIDRAGAAELLLRSLRAGHPTTRWNAAMALGRLGRDAGVRERLRREAERPQVEVTALFAYARACVEGRQFADAERALHDLERRAVPDNQRPRLEQAFEDLRALKAEEQRGALSWPMYRGSPGGSAYTPSHLSLPLDLKWEFATSDCVYSSPAVSGGTVFIGSDDGHLYALDADSGQERWQSATQGGVRSSPCVIGGTVFVGSLEGFVHAVEVESGRELWRRRVGRSVESSVRGDAERLYVGTGDGAVVAFAPDDGRELWKRPLSGAVIASPAFDDGTLAVGTAEDGLVLLDAASGEVRWRWKVDGGMRGSAALLPHRVVIGSGDGRVDVLDLEGELAWSAFLRGPVGSSPAVAHSRVYVGGTRGEVVALDLDTGATQWMFDAEGEISASPTVAAGVVFVGTQAGQLFGLDARTGEALWRYRTGYSIHSTPAVADRRLFVALRYYNMCAFAEASESDEARP